MSRSSFTTHRMRFGAAVVLALAASACAPPPPAQDLAAEQAALPAPVVDQHIDVAALVAAAKKEGSVTVYDSSGDIVKVAKAFTAKYGIKATGVKADVGDTQEKMTREAQAGKSTIDLTLYESGPTLVGELLPQKVVYTYLPSDLLPHLPQANRNPLTVLSKAMVWVYNPQVFPHGCPVDNIWDVTTPEWTGKTVMQDPLSKPYLIEWFTQMAAGYDKQLRAAYEKNFGKPLDTSAESAAHEWVARFAGNRPVLTSADDDVSAAVGAPNQTAPRFGFVSIAKFRDVRNSGYHLAVCDTMAPFTGFQYPKFGAIATGSAHPNAAKLFLHFVLTEEGIAPEMSSGGISGNATVPPSKYNPPGLTDWDRQLVRFDRDQLLADFRGTEPMQDHWRLSRS
ncbi:ABC transporter substrate-binding protein [Amycolatopsis jejuensis]|uniref:ABC transporter substrate-binding protein n=1 Tax=Amycolatopsis jejuensis TaxID=330084 RepID=UPI0005244BDA|nr:ABC transporter substrate-binding protein [Amycolatopsis jejuensis]